MTGRAFQRNIFPCGFMAGHGGSKAWEGGKFNY